MKRILILLILLPLLTKPQTYRKNYVNINNAAENYTCPIGWTSIIFQDEFDVDISSPQGWFSPKDEHGVTLTDPVYQLWNNRWRWHMGWANFDPWSSAYSNMSNFVPVGASGGNPGYLNLETRFIEDGTLEAIPGNTPSPNYPVLKYYTTSMITSTMEDRYKDQTFLYGYFETRIRMPKNRYSWPAFWLFGTEGPYYEIDGFEFGANDESTLTYWFHPENVSKEDGRSAKGMWLHTMPGQDFSLDDKWVTWAIKWEPNKIICSDEKDGCLIVFDCGNSYI